MRGCRKEDAAKPLQGVLARTLMEALGTLEATQTTITPITPIRILKSRLSPRVWCPGTSYGAAICSESGGEKYRKQEQNSWTWGAVFAIDRVKQNAVQMALRTPTVGPRLSCRTTSIGSKI